MKRIKVFSCYAIFISISVFLILAYFFRGNNYFLLFTVSLCGIVVIIGFISRGLASEYNTLVYNFQRRESAKYLFCTLAVGIIAITVSTLIFIPKITYSHTFEKYFLSAVQENHAPDNFNSSGDKMVTYMSDDYDYSFSSKYIPSCALHEQRALAVQGLKKPQS